MKEVTLVNFLAYVCMLIVGVQSQGTADPLVTTPLGKIQGTVLTSRLGKAINSFKGIRYAKPPIDELRFKPPVPFGKWDGVYNATQDGFSCPQPFNDPISEDCLILNVYTTKLPNSRENPKRPVIIHIHPGGFYSSTSVSYWAGPEYFMDQDVVLVTFNYRIGSLGFLSTGDKEAPGNNGFKDQVEVFKWVKQNIESFGGDPDSVTLLGYSAGAWSIVLHMISPMSEGLFHKGVVMSGSPLGQWPIPQNGQLDVAKKQARIVGCPDNDTTANIVKCLRTVPYQALANSLLDFREFGNYLLLVWSPVVEPDIGQPRFLTDNPTRLIASGKFRHIPLILGRTSDEFGYFAVGNVLQNQTLSKELNENFEKIAPVAFAYERGTDFSRYVSKNIRKFYFQDKPIDQSQKQALEDLYEDLVGFQVHRATKLIAQQSTKPVYYYRFSYKSRYSNFYMPDTNNTVPYGVVHHDDLTYLFYISRIFPRFGKTSPKEVEMVETLTTLYANFARTGNPTPFPSNTPLGDVTWQRYTLQDQKYLDIGSQLVMKEKLNERRMKEWDRLYPISMYLNDNTSSTGNLEHCRRGHHQRH